MEWRVFFVGFFEGGSGKFVELVLCVVEFDLFFFFGFRWVVFVCMVWDVVVCVLVLKL